MQVLNGEKIFHCALKNIIFQAKSTQGNAN